MSRSGHVCASQFTVLQRVFIVCYQHARMLCVVHASLSVPQPLGWVGLGQEMWTHAVHISGQWMRQ